MNIYEKMQKITEEIGTVNKNLEVNAGKASYKAVGEADVLKAVKEMETKHKIYSYPIEREIVDSEILQTEKTYNGQTTKGTQQFMRIKTTYRFINIEEPKEYIDIISYGDGIDTQDKAPGKAMTYSDKYALLKAYKIVTGDDPDQNGSENTNWNGKAKSNNQKVTMKANEAESEKINEKYVQAFKNWIQNHNINENVVANVLLGYGYNRIEDIQNANYKAIVGKLNETLVSNT